MLSWTSRYPVALVARAITPAPGTSEHSLIHLPGHVSGERYHLPNVTAITFPERVRCVQLSIGRRGGEAPEGRTRDDICGTAHRPFPPHGRLARIRPGS